jgi:hypothetical protein
MNHSFLLRVSNMKNTIKLIRLNVGILAVLSIAFGLLGYNTGPFMLVYETLLLWLTRIAWFTKAGLIFRD